MLTSLKLFSYHIALNDFKEALDAASSTTLWEWGVATSASDWEEITGSLDWELDGTVPLWYEVGVNIFYFVVLIYRF